MLAQQMQIANAMMPGAQLQPVVRRHECMNRNIQCRFLRLCALPTQRNINTLILFVDLIQMHLRWFLVVDPF